MLKIKLSLLLLTATVSCIDTYELPTNSDKRILTVDGLITTELGPHTVRLSLSSIYSNQIEGNILPLYNAEVWLTDNLENRFDLTEEIFTTQTYFDTRIGRWVTLNISRPSGIYKTDKNFKAKIGNTYNLNIKTKDRGSYKSESQTVNKVPILDSIAFRPHRVPTKNPLLDQTGMIIDAFFSDDDISENYYLWKTGNSWGVLNTYPELFSPAKGVIAPKDCCKKCYLQETRMKGYFKISNDFLFNGLTTQFPILFLVEDGFRFMERYKLEIKQYSITKDAFEFLILVDQQLSIQGSVFDPLPANIRGNITNIEDPKQQVLGFFMVSDVSTNTIYINRSDLPFEYRKPVARVHDDCREFTGFTGSFFNGGRIGTEPPNGWEDN